MAPIRRQIPPSKGDIPILGIAWFYVQAEISMKSQGMSARLLGNPQRLLGSAKDRAVSSLAVGWAAKEAAKNQDASLCFTAGSP